MTFLEIMISYFTRKIPFPENPARDYGRNIYFSCIFSPRQLVLIVSCICQQIFFTFCIFTAPPGGLFWRLNKKPTASFKRAFENLLILKISCHLHYFWRR